MATEIPPSQAAADAATQIPAELEAARALAPEVASRALEFEAARRLPADLARKFAEAGLFRITIPLRYGGAELHPRDFVRVLEEVARADGSAGWCLMIGATTAVLAGILPEATAREIYADRLVITGGAVAPTASAIPKQGGFIVSGRWQWGSGCQNCQWLVGGAIVTEAGQPRRTAQGEPEIRLMIFPAGAVEILDTWDSAGLRGTGSHDFIARDAFVPIERSLSLGNSEPTVPRPLYRFPFFGLLAIGVCSVSLGIARRAIDEFVGLAATKVPTWERAAAGAIPAMDLRRDLRLAAANAAWQSVKAVDLMYHAGGGSAVHSKHPLQRCLRDVHTVTQHVMVNQSMYEQTGRMYLGIGPVPALL
jgi:indole-3-acetate monooxygenase